MGAGFVAVVVFVIGIIAISCLWFGLNYVVLDVAQPTHDFAVQQGVNDTEYEQSYGFLITFHNWIPMLAFFLLIITLAIYVILDRK